MYIERYQKGIPTINFTYTYPVNNKIPFDEAASLNLLRITQELVSNSVKYSGAKNISIDLTIDEKGKFSYRYKEDGKGFEMTTPRLGAGVSNVHLRASSIGANLRYDTSLGKGVFVEIIGK